MASSAPNLETFLRQCVETGELIGFCPWGDQPDGVCLGFVRAVGPPDASLGPSASNVEIALECLDPRGQPDSSDLWRLPLRRFVKVSRGDPYFEGVLWLREAGDSFRNGAPAEEASTPAGVRDALGRAASEGLAVTVEYASHPRNHGRRSGLVVGAGPDWVSLIEDSDGGLARNGTQWLPLRRIKRVGVNDECAQVSAFLLRRRGVVPAAPAAPSPLAFGLEIERVLHECARHAEPVALLLARDRPGAWGVAVVRAVERGRTRLLFLDEVGAPSREEWHGLDRIEWLARQSAYLEGIARLHHLDQQGSPLARRPTPFVARHDRVDDELARARDEGYVISFTLAGAEVHLEVLALADDFVVAREIDDGGHVAAEELWVRRSLFKRFKGGSPYHHGLTRLLRARAAENARSR